MYKKAAFALLKYDKPAYLRLTGTTNSPQVYEKDYDFKIGKSITIKKGKMGTIFCTGSIGLSFFNGSKQTSY